MIKLIRGVTVVALFIFFGLGALFVRYFVFPFQKVKIKQYEMLQKMWQLFVAIIEKIKIIKVEVNNLEKIKNIKNSIIVSTHPSFIDIIILISIIPHSTCFVAKKLANNPFLKGMVDLLFIVEEDTEKWLSKCLDKLNSGLNVIIFPMGRRHEKDEYPKIKRGTSLIAQCCEKDIIMLDIQTNIRFLKKNQPVYEAGDSPILYTIKYLGEINTKEYLKKYSDSVTFKTEITKLIKECLYQFKN